MNIHIWIQHKHVKAFCFNNENTKLLQSLLPDVDIRNYKNSESFKKDLKFADIVLIWVFKQEWLDLAPNLKWIATPAAGKDFFNVTLPEGIIKTHGSFHGIIMAETVLGMMLAFSRGILKLFEFKDKISWPDKEISPYMNTLQGSNLLIIGFGSIGQQIAKLAKSFGMKITGVKRNMINPPDYFGIEDKIVLTDKLDAALKVADHVVLVLPGVASSTNILKEKRFKLMKKTACIYNVGRGNAIDEKALIKSLKSKKIKGAFLDVFKHEPLPFDSPLRNCPNLFIMPHASAISPNYMDLFIDEFLEKYKVWKKIQ
ncbi:MAG: D-2-hydroxyacid dehydrogenase [Spirochaetes bacterium]|nr:D-2-hydroxyacid dehydrogenase [Spirochaetota bacterium]